ncbi:unnamed protein product [Polarella glacialis]|uniref:Aminoglycoside phosphotransferase domain-containing protein n=1 Tax=Polarella glacialis TaxID=89957 RepID=A0A813FZV0_POLGL|nr:unnamed protein product [Polarella glacialis]CAE8657543.1 unnamed protein product [Polarella glacialis]
MSGPGQSTVEVAEGLRFDEASLQRFLSAAGLPGVAADGPKLSIKKFGYGQSNPTYFLETAAGHKYVLRKQPPGKIIKGAHAVDREFKVIKAVGEAGFEVPEMHVFCDDAGVIGTPFYVMAFVKGVIPDNALLQLAKEHRRPAMKSIVQSLAKLHSYDPCKLGLLQDCAGKKPFGRMGGFYERQISTLARTSEAQVSGSEGKVPPMRHMQDLLALFKANMPEDRSCVIHGDWKPDNVILTRDSSGAPEVLAVLDWELSTIGHPMSDLANLCLPYHLGPLGAIVGIGSIDVDPDSGMPTEDEVHRTYCEAAGVKYPISGWSFFVSFSCFRLSVIIQGVAMRASRGQASSAAAAGNVVGMVMSADALCDLACDIMRKSFGPSTTGSRL